MCGRVRLPEDYSEIKIDLKLHEVVPHTYSPRWNVPPTEMLPVITSKEGKRRLEPMRWGLIPSWAKDPKRASRASTLAPTVSKPSGPETRMAPRRPPEISRLRRPLT